MHTADKPTNWDPLIVFGIALVARGVHLVQILAAAFFPFLMGDSAGYDEWARTIAAGNWVGDEVFYQAPMYPYFLALVYAAVGDDLFIVRAVQCLIGSLSAVWLYDAGSAWFNRRAGLVAGLWMALYAPAIFFDNLIQKSVLDVFFLTLLLWILATLVTHAAAWRWAALGAVAACLVLCRENAMVLVFAIAAWIPWYFRKERRQWVGGLAMMFLGLAVILVPVAVRNYSVGGEWHLTTSQFGPNFFIGNNETAEGLYLPLVPHQGSVQHERADATQLAEAEVGRELSPAEVSSYWTGRAWTFIRAHPTQWLRLLARKFALTWNHVEVADTEDQYTYADSSWVLTMTGWVLTFGTLAPVAAFGVLVTWPQRRRVAVLYLMIGAYAASVILFYVFARYRYPLCPMLILLAAAGLAEAPTYFAAHRMRRALLAGIVVTLVALFCHWPLIGRNEMRAIMHYNLGVEFDQIGELEQAIEQYSGAVGLQPDYLSAYLNLGADQLETGRVGEAIDTLEHAWKLAPQSPRAMYNLSVALISARELNRAEQCLNELVRLYPQLPEGYHHLALVEISRGNPATARQRLEQALQANPGFTPSRQLLLEIGDRE